MSLGKSYKDEYSSTAPLVATVDSSGLVTIVGVGTTEIRANQLGEPGYYNAPPQVAQTLIVIAPALPVVSGLACWYDPGVGVTEAAVVVQSWEDSSTLGRLAARASGSPTLVPNDINGRPAVHLTGSSTYLNCAGGMFTKEQYVVVRSPNPTWNGSGSFLGRASSQFLSVRASSYNLANGTTGFWQDHYPQAVSRNGVPLALNASGGSGFALDPITDYMLLKIDVDDTASAQNLIDYPYYQIGQNETLGSCDMDIAEIVGYDRALSPEEDATVSSFLAGKYGLTMGSVSATTTLQITPPDGFGNFTISGTTSPGLTVTLYKSIDLSLGAAGWSQVDTTTADGGGAFIFYASQGADPQAFYLVKP